MRLPARPALVISLVALCASCAAPAPQSSPASEAPRADDAAFVTGAEAQLEELGELARRTQWVYETYITPDTEWLRRRATSEATAARMQLAAEASRRLPRATDPTLRRKLELLRTSLVLPAPSRLGASEELAALTTELSSLYATGRIELAGREMRLDELEVLMQSERHPARLEEMWTKWHDVARPMAPRYERLVTLANEGARELGFADVGELWRSGYEMPPAELAAEVERLWQQVAPLYEQLHCHVRAGLAAHYGQAIMPAGEPIRADLLGNMWAQQWGGVEPLVETPGAGAGFDVTELLAARGYDARRMFETGERFYTSLGLAPLPESFWQRSLFERPPGREVQCHASAWSVDARDDLRVKMCTRVNEQDFRTVHHELGHNYYLRAYKDQPFLFRWGAHDGFHEAIGDFAALNVTPEYLATIGLLGPAHVPPADADLALLLREALNKVAFLPFAYVVDTWRWRVFAGDISPAEYDDAWWELRRIHQGVRPPAPRPAGAFDPGAKNHVATNVPYLRYFLAYVLQFQLYEAACRQAGWSGPLHRCSVYGDREVGARFQRMLELGRSRPWPDALETFTGSRRMDASALARYFEPLGQWLHEKNRDRQCGWTAK